MSPTKSKGGPPVPRKEFQVASSKGKNSLSKRIIDLCLLFGSALLFCVLMVGAYAIAEARHMSPGWVFFGGISLVFLVGVREEYRKEFRSWRFVVFVCGWAAFNLLVVVVVLGSFGLLYLIPALLLDQFFFYMTAYWLFGLEPPLRRTKRLDSESGSAKEPE